MREDEKNEDVDATEENEEELDEERQEEAAKEEAVKEEEVKEDEEESTEEDEISKLKAEVDFLKKDRDKKGKYIANRRRQAKLEANKNVTTPSKSGEDSYLNELSNNYTFAMESAENTEDRMKLLKEYTDTYNKYRTASADQEKVISTANSLDSEGSEKYEDWNEVIKNSTFGLSDQNKTSFHKDLISLGDIDDIYEAAKIKAMERHPLYSKTSKKTEIKIKKVANPPQRKLKNTPKPPREKSAQENHRAYLESKYGIGS